MGAYDSRIAKQAAVSSPEVTSKCCQHVLPFQEAGINHAQSEASSVLFQSAKRKAHPSKTYMCSCDVAVFGRASFLAAAYPRLT